MGGPEQVAFAARVAVLEARPPEPLGDVRVDALAPPRERVVALEPLRQAEHRPVADLERVRGRVVLVEALHDEHLGGVGLLAAGDDGVVPVVRRVEYRARGGLGIAGVEEVVEDDPVAVLAEPA